MTFRATRQYAEVLFPGSGSLRVTRQYVDVLVKAPIEQTVTDTLTFSEIIIDEEERTPFPSLPVDDALVFVEELGWYIGNLEPYDTITFVESNSYYLNRFIVADVLVLSDSVVLSDVYELEVIDVLTLTDTNTGKSNSYSIVDTLSFVEDIDIFEIVRAIYDDLVFTESIVTEFGGIYLYIRDSLTLVDSAKADASVYYSISDSLEFEDSVVHLVPYNITVLTLMDWAYNAQGFPYRYLGASFSESITRQLLSTKYKNDDLSLTETIGAVLEKASADSQTVDDTIVFTEEHNVVYGDTDTLVFSETLLIDQCLPISDDLVFVDSVTKELSFNAPLSESLTFIDLFTYNIVKIDTTKIYSPFIGSTTDISAPSPPPLQEETYTYYDNVQIFYPKDTSATLIELHGPDLGDIDRSGHSRVNSETRGGTLIIYADPIWPRNRSLVLNFNGISELNGSDLLDLFNTSLGNEIGVRDWYGRTWVGILTNPDSALVYNQTCDLSLQLEIDCVRFFINDLVDSLVLSETISHELI